MPFYDYRCSKCDAKVTLMQGMNEEPATICPECGSPSLHKIMSAGIFAIKGQRCSCNPTSDTTPSSCCAHCPHKE